ncbi:hypothetical protein VIGAN_10061200 [Vigna angularis var. angularis]|uniref:Uncharacterized protein n=1 Tax=Vigna angularis var. angularis TaxID=157739 RepID=A0A0S3T2T4_PHAAN|nr:hypothetical protein VIGAN_10061200 [Vigna angularis var. angularis]
MCGLIQSESMVASWSSRSWYSGGTREGPMILLYKLDDSRDIVGAARLMLRFELGFRNFRIRGEDEDGGWNFGWCELGDEMW